jgi:hypothetical protein
MAKPTATNTNPRTPVTRTAPGLGPAGKLGTAAALLRRPEGATLAQLTEATGWQAHSVRGALAGALSKRHGLVIASEKVDGTRVYRAVTGENA